MKHVIKFQIYIIVIGIFLTVVKFSLYFETHSNSILSDALESIVNIIAGIVTLISLNFASKPKDENHPYGHGKIEFVSAMFEGSLLAVTGFYSFYKVIDAYLHPMPLHHLQSSILIIAVLGVVNYLMGVVSHREGSKANSPALLGSAQHLKSDGYSSLGLIIGLILIELFHWQWLDLVIALVVSFIIMYQGMGVIKEAMSGILDETDTTILKNVIAYLEKNRRPIWIDMHNLRIVKYGSDYHIDAHVTMPWYMSNQVVHDELKEMHDLINEHFSNEVELFIHCDPCVPDSCHVCQHASCDQRLHPFSHYETWTIDNVIKNEKHKPQSLPVGATTE